MANTTVLNLVKPLGTDHALVSDINANSDKIDVEAGKVRANFSAEYSASSAYAVGAFCTHDGNVYQCNTAIGSGGEAWTAGHWTQVSVGDAIAACNQAIANLKTNTVLTATRTENNLVNATAFARLEFYKKAGVLIARLNLAVSAAVASMSDFVEIGRITGWNATAHIDICVPPQNGSNKVMLVEITYDGIIKIFGQNGLDDVFYRSQVAVPEYN